MAQQEKVDSEFKKLTNANKDDDANISESNSGTDHQISQVS